MEIIWKISILFMEILCWKKIHFGGYQWNKQTTSYPTNIKIRHKYTKLEMTSGKELSKKRKFLKWWD